MTPVEILNTLGERNEPSFRPFVDPDEYDESRFIRINGKLSRVDRGDYLTSFVNSAIKVATVTRIMTQSEKVPIHQHEMGRNYLYR